MNHTTPSCSTLLHRFSRAPGGAIIFAPALRNPTGAPVASIGLLPGRKALKSDNPAGRADTRVLEAIFNFDGETPLVSGRRVDVFIHPATGNTTPEP